MSSSHSALSVPPAPPPPPPAGLPDAWNWPPFFTLQPVLATRERQLAQWADLLRQWCAAHRVYELDVGAELAARRPPLCNEAIQRRLSEAAAVAVLDSMVAHGQAEWLRPDGSLAGGDNSATVPSPASAASASAALSGAAAAASSSSSSSSSPASAASASRRALILWQRPEDWAAQLLAWARNSAQLGAVFTLYELRCGDAARGEPFEGLDERVLLRAVQWLAQRKQAVTLRAPSGDIGVKFVG